MRSGLFILATGALVITQAASARIVSRQELIKTVNDLKGVNGVIESEIDVTRGRCMNQAARKKNIDDTLASFSSQVTQINNTIASVTAERAPHLTALNNAKSLIAQKISEISTLDGRIRNLGRDSAREQELKTEKAQKEQQKLQKTASQIALRNQFDTWEAQGNNSRVLDNAHVKLAGNPNAVLTANERLAIDYETRFNSADEALTEALQALSTSISAINTELANIAVADGRTLTQLRTERDSAMGVLRDNERIRDREAPQVAQFNVRLKGLQSSIAQLTGFRPAEPINPDCTLLLQTQ
jgi:chromosome segregation ATPase